MDDALRFYAKVLNAREPVDVIKEARRQLARYDLFYLLTVEIGRSDIAQPWLFDAIREVEAEPDGCLDLWAREHYKSTIITFGLSIQDILASHGEDADDRYGGEVTIGIFSNTRPLAKGFLRQIKLEFEQNTKLKALFPDVLWDNPKAQAPKWSEDDGLIVRRRTNPKEATVEAWGLVDAQPIGKHFKVRDYDDVVTPKSVTTPEMIRKTTEAVELSDNLGTKDGVERFIGTRYHFGDTYGVQIERGVLKVRMKPATHNGRLDGNPVFLPVEVWEKKKRTQPTTIAAQMLQNPAAGQDATFLVKWLRFYTIRPATLRIYILCDPSKGRSRKSDNTAMAVIGVDAAHNRYLLDGVCHRMDLAQRWATLKMLHQKWSKEAGITSVQVGYEQYGLLTDIEHFKIMMQMPPVYSFPIAELNWPREGIDTKRDRVERLVPDFKGGKFLLPGFVHHENRLCRPVVEQDEFQNDVVRYREVQNPDEPTKEQRQMIAIGQEYRIARPIKRIDQDQKVYDLTLRLIEEMRFFPFGTRDDLVDATSRVYDLHPVAAQAKPSQDQLEPAAHSDGV